LITMGRSSKRRSRKRRLAIQFVDAVTTLQASPGAATAADGSDQRPSPQAGLILGDRYRLKHPVSACGMGEVWVATQVALGFDVALKILHAEIAGDPEHRARFRREALLMTRLRTDRVVRVLDYFVDTTFGPVLIMELIRGASLASLLAARRWTVEEAIELGIELATGLADLHDAHVIHRDIKPANILMVPQEDGQHRSVIIDFGVSLLAHSTVKDDTALASMTGADGGVGTVHYMAPEQLVSAHNVTERADLYALGAVLFRAVTGEYVFADLKGPDLAKAKLSQESPDLSTGRWDHLAIGFRDIVGKALRRDPALRYASAAEMRRDLLALRPRRVHEKQPPIAAAWQSMRSFVHRPKAAAAMFALGVLSALAGGAAVKMVFGPAPARAAVVASPSPLALTPDEAARP
jgi:serine/threonine protein kinase